MLTEYSHGPHLPSVVHVSPHVLEKLKKKAVSEWDVAITCNIRSRSA